jgi:uncharacterized protein (DUF1697 family)
MKPHIALFRAVNVGGRTVLMSDLRAMFEDLGLGPAVTLQAAGSVVFQAKGDPDELEARLEAAALEKLNLSTSVFVRDRAAWAAVIAANPFGDAAAADPSRLMVMTLKTPPDPTAAAELEAVGTSGERVAVRGTCAYLHFPQGAGTTKLTPRLIESRLGSAGTMRNWNTTLKLAALMAG